MTLLRTVARPLLASMFVYGGVNALRNASAMAPKAQPFSDQLQPLAPKAPLGPANLVRINGAVHVVAGTALATGRVPRLSALALAASLVPTTAAGHQFWNETDPASRTNQRIHFLKNLSMAGGLLMATLDPDPHKKILVRRAKDKVAEATGTVADQLDSLRR
ncbi:DoxX family protein [Aeromicrobium marinum DSM 15272]|uniref:DoxX family protein n=1 Tax=Aeromicrobium marinum DSM 15272 TaxID=585531 RepID=E2SCL2_9ACTN|nr:DoxX family protein [Aeromicrobium marinum]EFQ82965.1 DoxX family protein [Aeromicrobium marinum DSM 15272]